MPKDAEVKPNSCTIDCEEGKHDDCKGWGETIFRVPREVVTCQCPCHSKVGGSEDE